MNDTNPIIERIRGWFSSSGGHSWRKVDLVKYREQIRKIDPTLVNVEDFVPKYECANCGLTRHITRKVFAGSECAFQQVKRVHNS